VLHLDDLCAEWAPQSGLLQDDAVCPDCISSVFRRAHCFFSLLWRNDYHGVRRTTRREHGERKWARQPPSADRVLPSLTTYPYLVRISGCSPSQALMRA